MFENPLLLITAILAFGFAAVLLPVALDAYRRYRYRKVISCPETHGFAEVKLNAGRAAIGAAWGQPTVRVRECSLWPKRRGCDEKCVGANWPAP